MKLFEIFSMTVWHCQYEVVSDCQYNIHWMKQSGIVCMTLFDVVSMKLSESVSMTLCEIVSMEVIWSFLCLVFLNLSAIIWMKLSQNDSMSSLTVTTVSVKNLNIFAVWKNHGILIEKWNTMENDRFWFQQRLSGCKYCKDIPSSLAHFASQFKILHSFVNKQILSVWRCLRLDVWKWCESIRDCQYDFV